MFSIVCGPDEGSRIYVAAYRTYSIFEGYTYVYANVFYFSVYAYPGAMILMSGRDISYTDSPGKVSEIEI